MQLPRGFWADSRRRRQSQRRGTSKRRIGFWPYQLSVCILGGGVNTSLITRRGAPGGARLLRLRLRKWSPGKHLFAIGRMIDKRGHDGRRLREISTLNTVIHVHIGVMRPRPVLQRILNERKSGNTDSVERLMIRPARAPNRAVADGPSAEVGERRKPLGDNRPERVVAPEIHAANPSAASVDIEI